MMSALPDEDRHDDLLRAKQLLEAALEILDRNQVWAIAAPVSGVVASLEDLIRDEDTLH